jgi:hypothetical protein
LAYALNGTYHAFNRFIWIKTGNLAARKDKSGCRKDAGSGRIKTWNRYD